MDSSNAHFGFEKAADHSSKLGFPRSEKEQKLGEATVSYFGSYLSDAFCYENMTKIVTSFKRVTRIKEVLEKISTENMAKECKLYLKYSFESQILPSSTLIGNKYTVEKDAETEANILAAAYRKVNPDSFLNTLVVKTSSYVVDGRIYPIYSALIFYITGSIEEAPLKELPVPVQASKTSKEEMCNDIRESSQHPVVTFNDFSKLFYFVYEALR